MHESTHHGCVLWTGTRNGAPAGGTRLRADPVRPQRGTPARTGGRAAGTVPRHRGGELEVVVNNAGFGLFGEFVTTDLDAELRMIDTNVRAVHILTKLAVRDFVQRGRGYILNVSSSAGFLPGPLMATYYATKNYVLRLTEALREELRRAGSPVRVCALCPGPVDTEFNKVAGVRFSLSGLSAERVAREAVDGLFAGKAVVVPGAAMKAMTLARHFAPDSILARITYHFQHKKGAK